MIEYLRLFLYGIIIGIANVVPGVSGGTLVVVFNLYDRLVDSVSLNVKKLWSKKGFLLPLLLGMGSGILVFSKLVTVLYLKFPYQTSSCFTGIVLGSIPLLIRMVFAPGKKAEKASEKETGTEDEKQEASEKDRKKSAGKIIGLSGLIVFGILVMFCFYFLNGRFQASVLSENGLPDFSLGLAGKMFLAGFAAAVAMIIPGISGSLLMVIIGVYTVVMAALSGLTGGNFVQSCLLLLPFGFGVLGGLLAGVFFMKWVLKKIPEYTYAVILGLILGSVIMIFPGAACFESFGTGAGCIVCILAGFSVAFFSNYFAEK